MNINGKYKILLGSKSPRRRDLLLQAGFEFDVVSIDVEEDFDEQLNPQQVVTFLAEKKADGYRELNPGELLITCDTIVAIEGEILGKPKDSEEALAMLKKLNNNEHQVLSGVCLKSIDKKVSFHDETKVIFRDLLDKELKYYIESCSPFDKAGSYGIQEWIGMVGVKYICGSFYNVMGLPIHKLYEQIQIF